MLITAPNRSRLSFILRYHCLFASLSPYIVFFSFHNFFVLLLSVASAKHLVRLVVLARMRCLYLASLLSICSNSNGDYQPQARFQACRRVFSHTLLVLFLEGFYYHSCFRFFRSFFSCFPNYPKALYHVLSFFCGFFVLFVLFQVFKLYNLYLKYALRVDISFWYSWIRMFLYFCLVFLLRLCAISVSNARFL